VRPKKNEGGETCFSFPKSFSPKKTNLSQIRPKRMERGKKMRQLAAADWKSGILAEGEEKGGGGQKGTAKKSGLRNRSEC